jgi:hypothetical protein
MSESGSRAALILYHPGRLTAGQKSRFRQRLFGQITSTRGKRYHRTGLLEGIPHWRPMRGVLVVREVDRARVIRELRHSGVRHEWWPIQLTARQFAQVALPTVG